MSRITFKKLDRDAQENINEIILNSVLKRYKTVFIGSVDAIDKIIGVILWGHGKPEDELTDEDREWLPFRDKLRKKILDAGNKNMRDTEDQLSEYDFVQKKSFFPDGFGV